MVATMPIPVPVRMSVAVRRLVTNVPRLATRVVVAAVAVPVCAVLVATIMVAPVVMPPPIIAVIHRNVGTCRSPDHGADHGSVLTAHGVSDHGAEHAAEYTTERSIIAVACKSRRTDSGQQTTGQQNDLIPDHGDLLPLGLTRPTL